MAKRNVTVNVPDFVLEPRYYSCFPTSSDNRDDHTRINLIDIHRMIETSNRQITLCGMYNSRHAL
jgi:hypothetical protein